MPQPIETALIEASNPQTAPERLLELSEWELRDERGRLRQAIAANPNSDEALLLELAGEYPDEVVANPRFQLLLISDQPWWEDVEPISMLELLAALGSTAPTQARLAFFAQLGEQLTGTSPIAMNQEWHMSFSHDMTVWLNSCQQGISADEEEPEDDEDLDEDDEDLDELQWKDFTVDFSCVVGENHCFLNPPSFVERPLECLEQLINIQSKDEILDVLERHGWEIESDSTPGGQGYWEIEDITPQLDGWEFVADLLGDRSGSIQITDPAGETYEVEVDAPTDYGDEYSNPTLNEHPDLIGDIFRTSVISSAELIGLLGQVIVIEKLCRLTMDLEEFRSQTEVARLMRLKSTP